MSRMRIRKSQKLFTVWKEGNKYEQSKTLVCSCAGGIDAVSAYENPLYFSRVFKKEIGKSPAQYRKERVEAEEVEK